MRVAVTSFSLSLDSVVEMGGVTPRYLSQTGCSWVDPGLYIVKLTLDCYPFAL